MAKKLDLKKFPGVTLDALTNVVSSVAVTASIKEATKLEGTPVVDAAVALDCIIEASSKKGKFLTRPDGRKLLSERFMRDSAAMFAIVRY